jgi:hypothetical protein
MARPVETDTDRGRFVLAARGDIMNNGARVVEDRIRELLESGAWRSYTYPDGTHHQWLNREFDYFMCAWIISANTEWEFVKRNIVSPDVKLLLAEHSGTTDGKAEDRRAVEHIRDQFPGVDIQPITLISEHERRVAHLTDENRSAYLNGASARKLARAGLRTWKVEYRDNDDLAGLIVAKLEREPGLAKAVYNHLRSGTRSDGKVARTKGK